MNHLLICAVRNDLDDGLLLLRNGSEGNLCQGSIIKSDDLAQ